MSACDDARLAVSLVLDGELGDVGRRKARRHLRSCAECRSVAVEMEAATTLLRRSALVPFRCELQRARLARTRHGKQWAGAAVAVLALVLATGALPQPRGAPAPPRTVAVAPLTLPIGQRSALDDFSAHAATTTRAS